MSGRLVSYPDSAPGRVCNLGQFTYLLCLDFLICKMGVHDEGLNALNVSL